jgi:hypothetical protein
MWNDISKSDHITVYNPVNLVPFDTAHFNTVSSLQYLLVISFFIFLMAYFVFDSTNLFTNSLACSLSV